MIRQILTTRPCPTNRHSLIMALVACTTHSTRITGRSALLFYCLQEGEGVEKTEEENLEQVMQEGIRDQKLSAGQRR